MGRAALIFVLTLIFPVQAADLSGALLAGANLNEAMLSGAVLSGAKGISGARQAYNAGLRPTACLTCASRKGW